MPLRKIFPFRYSSFPCILFSVKGIGENPKHGIPIDLKYFISVDPGHIIGTILTRLKKNLKMTQIVGKN